jgi:signal transduction histidine kinase
MSALFRPFSTIRGKLYLLLIGALVPILIIEGFDHYYRFTERQSIEYHTNLDVARAVSVTFKEYIRNTLKQQLAIGLSLTYPQPPTQQQMNALIKKNMGTSPELRNLKWINPQGRVIAAGIESYVGLDISNRAYLKEVLAGKDWSVSGLVLSEVAQVPIIAVSRRIYNPEGRLLGFIAATIYPDRLGKLLHIGEDHKRTISIFDKNGIVVFNYPAEDWDWDQRNAFRNYPAIKEAVSGKEITTTISDFYNGEKWMVALTPVGFNGWTVGSSRPVDQVFQPIISRSIMQAVILAALIIFVFMAAMLVSQKIVSPLKQLHKQVSALGQGTGHPKVSVSGSLEIKDLSSAFNKMTEEISRREKTLGAARQRLYALLEAIPAFVYLQAPNYSITYANRTFRETFGDPEGRLCHDILRGDTQPCDHCTVNTPLVFGVAQDWKWTSRNGRIYRVYDRPFDDFDGTTLVLKMGVDITEQESAQNALRQSENQLRQLSSRLFSAQEAERKRIAGELHDSIGQTLAAIKFTVEKVLQTPVQDRPEEALRAISFIFPFIENAIQEMRAIYMGLRPPILDSEGIIAAMKWLCSNFQQTYPMFNVEMRHAIEEHEIKEELKIVILRVAQEALNNIAKYSRAKSVDLSLLKDNNRLRLEINDNGIGFDLKNHPKGLGLISMKERVELSGGNFFIESGSGHGTTIRAAWPA